MRPNYLIICTALSLLGFFSSSWADTYTLTPTALNSGGGQSVSSNYTAELSNMAGGVGSSANYTVRSGFAGQLFDVEFIPPIGLSADGDGTIITGQLANSGNATEFALTEPFAGLSLDADGGYRFDPTTGSYDGLRDGQTYQAIANWKAFDQNNFEINGEILITVTGVNDRPTISGAPLTAIPKDSVYRFQAIGADVDVNTILTYSITQNGDLPSWLSFDLDTGVLSGTPLNDDAGTTVSNIVITVSDGSLSASLEAFDIAVLKTQVLNLEEGWNLVSFYVEADDMTAATIFAPIQDKLLQVKNLTDYYNPSGTEVFNTLSRLSLKEGYWLKVSADTSLEVEGVVPAGASIDLKSGWNLVGYPRLRGEGVTNELASIEDRVLQIRNLSQTYDPSLPSFLNTLSTMSPGLGYWLNIDGDGTWKVGTVEEADELNFATVMTRSDRLPEENVSPLWGETTVYPNLGATVLAKVSIRGKPVAEGGVVGAFVGRELRGLQDVVLANGMSYVALNVNLNGIEEVSYRVWNPHDNSEYLVSGAMPLELGGIYGNPEVVELDAVEVVAKRLEVFSITSEPFGFSFSTMVGRSYTVEATSDFQTWEAVRLFEGSGGEVRFTAKPTASGKAKFFRVSVE